MFYIAAARLFLKVPRSSPCLFTSRLQASDVFDTHVAQSPTRQGIVVLFYSNFIS